MKPSRTATLALALAIGLLTLAYADVFATVDDTVSAGGIQLRVVLPEEMEVCNMDTNPDTPVGLIVAVAVREPISGTLTGEIRFCACRGDAWWTIDLVTGGIAS